MTPAKQPIVNPHPDYEFAKRHWQYDAFEGVLRTLDGAPVATLWYPDKVTNPGLRCQAVLDNGKRFNKKAEEVVWLLHCGQYPKCELQHSDHNPKNNAPDNLFEMRYDKVDDRMTHRIRWMDHPSVVRWLWDVIQAGSTGALENARANGKVYQDGTWLHVEGVQNPLYSLAYYWRNKLYTKMALSKSSLLCSTLPAQVVQPYITMMRKGIPLPENLDEILLEQSQAQNSVL